MEQTERLMTLWKGNCYAHVESRRDQLEAIKERYPEAETVVHPESLAEVREIADVVCSTEKMIAYCRESAAQRFVVVTESSIIHRMRRECPGKEFICAPSFDFNWLPTDACRCGECKYMKKNTLEKLRDCLANGFPQVLIPEKIRARALVPIQRMLALP